eukprot:464963-Rhodomonas_salina.1
MPYQYRTSRSTRLGTWPHALSQYRTSPSTSAGQYHRTLCHYHRSHRPIPPYASSVPGMA